MDFEDSELYLISRIVILLVTLINNKQCFSVVSILQALRVRCLITGIDTHIREQRTVKHQRHVVSVITYSSLLLFVTLKLLIWVELKFLFQKIFGEKKSANAEHNKGMMLELICGFFP